ncbi:hypothetical protein YZ82_01455 [Campylobacter hyointestinalis]|uniref:Uncharacterized protein n=1 Tax=Campylobacter hyointestinalis TaxID=198 RepID=A0A562XKD3_CAMHY|nr:hypothetical protein [Campylobacter hyointestinalis]TWO22609.1 hypothetical protein YZ82_01455 [Campylobacter hyointestinalis]
MDRIDSYGQHSKWSIDTMDWSEYGSYKYVDILDLMLRQNEIWDYLLSSPYFQDYLKNLAKSLDSDLEEAKFYFEENSWSEIKEFILENKDIQEDLNKKLTIDFNKSRFKLLN